MFGLCIISLVYSLVACAPKSTVVLVPDSDGSVGQISVSNEAGSVTIDQANWATVVRTGERAPEAPARLDPDRVNKIFAEALSGEPPPPVHFTLYFRSGSELLLPASIRLLPNIVTVIQQKMPTRVSVVGHSDTLGDASDNLELSLRRAKAVKQLLLDRGVDGTFVDVSSHGEENPVVKTGDNVANAKNRRVEVVIR
jgi:outer membrane protein OmpA-like peptidoglycan-associated protein